MTDPNKPPIMNGADARLARVQSGIESSIEELEAVKTRLRTLIDAVQTTRILTLPASWRQQVRYDVAFAREFVHQVDGEILKQILSECDEVDFEKVVKAVEEAQR